MRRQAGVTLTGFIIVAVIVIFILLFVFKVGPAYFENMQIQKQFKAVAADQSLRTATRREIEAAFAARMVVENIRAVQPSEMLITKDANQLTLSAEYSVKVPLVGNLSACMDFAPSSSKE